MNKTSNAFLCPLPVCTLLLELLPERLGELLGLAVINLLLAEPLLGESRSIGVLAEKDLLVLKRVLLLNGTALGTGLALGSLNDALDFGAVDETGKVGLRDDVGGKEEALLALVDGVELLDGGRGPDDETTEVTTGGELKEVESVDGGGLDTGKVAEALDELLAVGSSAVDDEGTAPLAVAAASELSLTSTELLRLLGLLNIGTSTDSLQETESTSSLGGRAESLGIDNERNLGNGSDLVTTGEKKGSDGGRSKGRGSSEAPEQLVSSFHRQRKSQPNSLLALVDLDVPLPPDLGGSEHATGSAHVTEGSLAGTVGTATGDTRDTGNSTTCCRPRLAILS